MIIATNMSIPAKNDNMWVTCNTYRAVLIAIMMEAKKVNKFTMNRYFYTISCYGKSRQVSICL